MTNLLSRLSVLQHDTPFQSVSQLIEGAGFVRTIFAGEADQRNDPAMAVWQQGNRTIVYARDNRLGLQTIASPEGLPPELLVSLPVMPADRAAELVAMLPFLSNDRKQRLQALRRLSRDARPVPPILHRTLGIALQDDDWEVIATAMLAAARLGATDLAPTIADIAFPENAGLGVGRQENRILLALKDATLAMLGQPRAKALPPGLLDAIDGADSGLPADVAAFVHSLIAPLPAPIAPPAPAAVVLTAYGAQTGDGRLLAWVPPGDYWLGHAPQPRGEPNPARRHSLAQGFYIEAEARDAAPLADALAAATACARCLGRPVSLATSDEWEMAARGPDGRRYPWGQNADPALRVDLSVNGMADIVSGPGEWLGDDAPDGHGLTTSGARNILLSARSRVAATEARAFRFVYPL